MNFENIENENIINQVESISELFEQDSRRFSRALTEEQEAKGR